MILAAGVAISLALVFTGSPILGALTFIISAAMDE